jgi:hypothetical protein
MRDGRSDTFGLAQQLRECGPVLHVGFGDDGRDEDASGVDQDVAFDALADDESTTAAVGCRRRPDRVRTSPRTAVSTLAQVPARHQRRKCLCAADQLTLKSCGRCRHAHPVRST